MARSTLGSWGRLPGRPANAELRWSDRSLALPDGPGSLLAYGNGRSYGDVCLNSGATLLHTRGMDRFIAFDADTGTLICEAGMLLSEILDVFVPRGWFLPVTPGTRFVTLGGAIANDVHGKNHHRAGSFGAHVQRFELLRSDGSRRVCSRQVNADWFAATIGGLGLTGLITWAEIRLKRISGVVIDVESTRFNGLDEFFAINAAAEVRHEYTVAWVDCLAPRPRGVFMAGDHSASGEFARSRGNPDGISLSPPSLPFSLVNRLTLRVFNQAYFNRPVPAKTAMHYLPFFYPLDGIPHWNRLYGRRGFYQYQFVLPTAGRPALDEVMRSIADSGQGSFLAVLKTLGDAGSPGLLSFPMPGVTLALDFPNRGVPTLALFERLDAIVAAAGGRIYPAKDARMSAAMFRRGYRRIDEFLGLADPRFSSDFARRVLM